MSACAVSGRTVTIPRMTDEGVAAAAPLRLNARHLPLYAGRKISLTLPASYLKVQSFGRLDLAQAISSHSSPYCQNQSATSKQRYGHECLVVEGRAHGTGQCPVDVDDRIHRVLRGVDHLFDHRDPDPKEPRSQRDRVRPSGRHADPDR